MKTIKIKCIKSTIMSDTTNKNNSSNNKINSIEELSSKLDAVRSTAGLSDEESVFDFLINYYFNNPEVASKLNTNKNKKFEDGKKLMSIDEAMNSIYIHDYSKELKKYGIETERDHMPFNSMTEVIITVKDKFGEIEDYTFDVNSMDDLYKAWKKFIAERISREEIESEECILSIRLDITDGDRAYLRTIDNMFMSNTDDDIDEDKLSYLMSSFYDIQIAINKLYDANYLLYYPHVRIIKDCGVFKTTVMKFYTC